MNALRRRRLIWARVAGHTWAQSGRNTLSKAHIQKGVAEVLEARTSQEGRNPSKSVSVSVSVLLTNVNFMAADAGDIAHSASSAARA